MVPLYFLQSYFTHIVIEHRTFLLNTGDLMKYLMLLSVLFAFNVKAETGVTISDEIALADEAILAPAMNIEGQYQVAPPVSSPLPKKTTTTTRLAVKKPLTSSERLKALRERLEERNRIMVEKKMEQIRFQQEIALARQLEASMNDTLKAIDNIK
jgi:hypothetical protein